MPLSPDDLESYLRLGLIQGVGHGRLARLIERFGDPAAVLRASTSQIVCLPGIGAEIARRIQSADSCAASEAVKRAIRRLARSGAVGITRDDPIYPAAFLDLDSPPFLLFAAGDLSLLDQPGIAVVGTRSPSRYGETAARRLSGDLALAGFVIVSGLARGIDSAAHRGAIDAGGTTIGVLGHGIDQVYPPENRGLFREVREQGLIVTEYPPGETPKPGNFPRRNRLITALSEAVVVVEMGHRSGAQHTVSYALEQGKEVLAVPGPIGSPRSAGTNQLIRDGARLVTSAREIIEELRGVGAGGEGPERVSDIGTAALPRQQDPPALALFNRTEEAVLAAIGAEDMHVDEVARSAGVTAQCTLTTLMELELRGLVVALPGMRFGRR